MKLMSLNEARRYEKQFGFLKQVFDSDKELFESSAIMPEYEIKVEAATDKLVYYHGSDILRLRTSLQREYSLPDYRTRTLEGNEGFYIIDQEHEQFFFEPWGSENVNQDYKTMMQRSDIQRSHYFVSVTRLLLSEHSEPRPVVELTNEVKLDYVVKCEVYITVYRYPKSNRKKDDVKERIMSRLDSRKELEAKYHLFMNSGKVSEKKKRNKNFNLVEVFQASGVSFHKFHTDGEDEQWN